MPRRNLGVVSFEGVKLVRCAVGTVEKLQRDSISDENKNVSFQFFVSSVSFTVILGDCDRPSPEKCALHCAWVFGGGASVCVSVQVSFNSCGGMMELPLLCNIGVSICLVMQQSFHLCGGTVESFCLCGDTAELLCPCFLPAVVHSRLNMVDHLTVEQLVALVGRPSRRRS